MADQIDPAKVDWDSPPAINPAKVQWDKPVGAKDRVQAAEGGFLRGSAYLAALPLDTVANAFNLGRAGLGAAYRATTGNDIPSALQVDSDVSPVGSWLTKQMDKSAITTTQPTHPEDPASRYLATAASVVPGVLSGSGTPSQLAKVTATAVPPAVAGQYVAEKRPFASDAANNAASIAATLLMAAAMPRGKGPDVAGREEQNAAIRDAQKEGLVFPPATTNPNATNKFVESVAGKQKIQQEFSLTNQSGVNALTRKAMNLGDANGPLTDAEFAQAKSQAAPGYDAIRKAGYVRLDKQFGSDIDTALSQQSGASRVAASLRDPAVEKIAQELKGNRAIDSSDAVDTIAGLREKSKAAYRAGESQNGAAYGGLAKAIEDAVDRSLTRRGADGTAMLTDYRNSRRQFAIINSADEARDASTGNIQANQLLTQFKRDAPLSGELKLIAKAAGQAPLAFKQPTSSPGVSHPGLLGALLGGAAVAHEVGGGWGAAPFLAAGALQGGRSAAKWYAKGPLQSEAIPAQRAPVNPLLVRALLGSTPGVLNNKLTTE
jgi:hypothetical protein